jgi:hypothetical protein
VAAIAAGAAAIAILAGSAAGNLLLVWTAGAGASTLSPTPFGIGVVEPALIAGLAAAGNGTPGAIGAVLLYRIMTFKIAGLIWVAYLHLRQRTHTGQPHRPAAPGNVTSEDARRHPGLDPAASGPVAGASHASMSAAWPLHRVRSPGPGDSSAQPDGNDRAKTRQSSITRR